jgi:hypothetical protein
MKILLNKIDRAHGKEAKKKVCDHFFTILVVNWDILGGYDRFRDTVHQKLHELYVDWPDALDFYHAQLFGDAVVYPEDQAPKDHSRDQPKIAGVANVRGAQVGPSGDEGGAAGTAT